MKRALGARFTGLILMLAAGTAAPRGVYAEVANYISSPTVQAKNTQPQQTVQLSKRAERQAALAAYKQHIAAENAANPDYAYYKAMTDCSKTLMPRAGMSANEIAKSNNFMYTPAKAASMEACMASKGLVYQSHTASLDPRQRALVSSGLPAAQPSDASDRLRGAVKKDKIENSVAVPQASATAASPPQKQDQAPEAAKEAQPEDTSSGNTPVVPSSERVPVFVEGKGRTPAPIFLNNR